MKKIYSSLCIIFSLFFLLSLSFARAQKTETFEKNYSVDSSLPVFLEFEDIDGNLSFSTWNKNLVRIHVTKKIKSSYAGKAEKFLQETRVEVSKKGNSIQVEIKYPRVEGIFFRLKDYQRVKVSTEIMLPLNSNLTCTLEDGSIYGEKVKGQMNIKTEDGDIFLHKHSSKK